MGLLWLALGAAIAIPVALFSIVAWTSWQNLQQSVEERLVRSLDIQQQEASRAFELIDLAMSTAGDLVTGGTPEAIAADSSRLHAAFEKLANAIAVVQSIWVYGPDGRALVSSWVDPPPPQNFSDRDFFQAHVERDVGTFYGQVYPSALNAEPFFTVSRRLTHEGKFAGVLEISVLPSSFFKFYASLASTRSLQLALAREDGLIFVRYPAPGPGASMRMPPEFQFHRVIATNPEGGLFTDISPIDGVERHYATRRLGATPLFLITAVESGAVRREWLGYLGSHLIYGVPATALLFCTILLVMQRTRRLYAEIDRRSIAEQSLRQSQKLEAVGQLTGGVAHDFNNLLTIILGNLEGLKRQLADADPRVLRRLDNATHGAERAATLTKRLLAFARQQPLNPVAVDINRLMNGLADFLRRGVGEHIELEVVGSGGLWPVEIDAAELESALLNLAVNARDAMPDGGKITIEAGNAYLDEAYCRSHPDLRAGQYVMVSVTDSGTGMSREVAERAFEPFYTTKPSGQGTGLGLSQVYGFVKQSGGHVKIYSEPGEGTSVKLYLPRFYGETAPAESAAGEIHRGGPGERVLVVEDDADVRAYVAETLAGLGYQVLEANSGERALKLLDEQSGVDLLLTDVIMPGMNGRQLANEARRRWSGLKVLFMTGYSRNAIVHHGRLDPDVELIQKPLSTEQIAQAVRRVLDA
jgi:signal transduction histidine kinase